MHEKTGAYDGGRNMKLKSTIRRIESPAEVKEEYKRYLQGILEAY